MAYEGFQMIGLHLKDFFPGRLDVLKTGKQPRLAQCLERTAL